MRYVYPRLPGTEARRLIEHYTHLDADELAHEADVGHPRAHTVPTGGPTAPPAKLRAARAAVLQAAAPWADQQQVPRRDVAEFDRAVGMALHGSMQILPADAAHEETWSFVTLVLLPDLAVRRFPDRHPSRLLGGQRNAFRRSWWRCEVLGELVVEGDPPLGEDELVGIFERSKMVRSRELARTLAFEILSYGGPDRSHFARQVMKLVRRQTGPRLLDILQPEELTSLVQEAAIEIEQRRQ